MNYSILDEISEIETCLNESNEVIEDLISVIEELFPDRDITSIIDNDFAGVIVRNGRLLEQIAVTLEPQFYGDNE